PDGRVQSREIQLRLPTVESVLPAEGDSIRPRPPKPLIVPPLLGEAGAWWLAFLLAAIATGLLGYWILDRRRRVEEEPPAVDPRDWALAQLDDDVISAVLISGGVPELYRRVSWILRTYLCRVDEAWSPDLTTTELLARLVTGAGEADARPQLQRLLSEADRVKFAGFRPGAERAQELVVDAREWIARNPTTGEDGEQGRAA